MSLTRRRIIGAAASITATGLLEGQRSQEEPSVLKGTASDGKVTLPPLQAATQLGGAPPNPDPAGQRMGVAVVGLGHLSLEQILPGFGQAKHVRVTALVSGDRAKASTIGLQYGVPETHLYDYANFDRIKENPDVDIVYIVLPNSLHAEYTVRAAQAGKHVLCEKPMATSVADAQRMIDACAQARRRLMIAYRLQYNAAHRAVIEMARRKSFGSVQLITATNGQNDAPNGQWRQIRSLSGGGSLPDVGLYCLNAFRYLTGEEPHEVTAQVTQPKTDPRFEEIENLCSFTLNFPSGVMAVGNSGYSLHENRHLRLIAENAWFGLDPAFGYDNLTLQIGRKAGQSNSEEQRRFSPDNQFATEMDHFAERIRENIDPLTPGEEGLQDQKLIKAMDTTRGPALKEWTHNGK